MNQHVDGKLVASLCIEELAASEAELLEQLLDLERERDAYKDMAHAALGQLHVMTVQSGRFEIRIAQLLNELHQVHREASDLRRQLRLTGEHFA